MLPLIFLNNIYDKENYYTVEPVNIHIQYLINTIQATNRVISTKKSKGQLPLFRGNRELAIPFYAIWYTHSLDHGNHTYSNYLH